MKIVINTILLLIASALPFHALIAKEENKTKEENKEINKVDNKEKNKEKNKEENKKESNEEKNKESLDNVINTLLSEKFAEASVKAAEKIKECEQKEHPFELNKEDKKYLEEYPKIFFTSLTLLSLNYLDNCSAVEITKLEDEYSRYAETLKKRGISNNKIEGILKKPHWLRPNRSEIENDLAKIPAPLKDYLIKRMDGGFFDVSQLLNQVKKSHKKNKDSD